MSRNGIWELESITETVRAKYIGKRREDPDAW